MLGRRKMPTGVAMPGNPQPKPTVAIVNNEESIRSSLSWYLENRNYTVRTYADTQSALALLDDPADVTLIDKTNPPLGGLELYRRIRARNKNPVIIMSAWADEVEQSLRHTGESADAYINVPFSQRLVEATIRTLLNASRRNDA
jgi:DNA-binding response OmpR family regulator